MRNRNSYIALINGLLLAITFFVSSCENEESKNGSKLFVERKSKSSFNLDDQGQLNQLAKIFSGESGAIKILKDAALVDLTDSKGNFKAISFQYQVGQYVTKMVVPVNEVPGETTGLESSKISKGATFYVRDTEACEMKCTTTEYCTACQQDIGERCKSQTCQCTAGNGGCTSSITFPAE